MGELDFCPTKEFPALQYLDSVELGSRADKAGLKSGDFLLEVCTKQALNWVTSCSSFVIIRRNLLTKLKQISTGSMTIWHVVNTFDKSLVVIPICVCHVIFQ